MSRVSASYAYCERLTHRAAGNFYPAMQLLPRAQRRAMYALYAFSRLTDDLADSDRPAAERDAALQHWHGQLSAGLAGDDSNIAWPALRHSVHQFAIPASHLFAIIEGCRMDVDQRKYATFLELYRYCTLVASAVGQACIHIWGFRGEKAPQYAEWAGVALQLTNILRDLGEDRSRGRVYLPQEDLAKFNCCVDSVCASSCDPRFQSLMRFETERAQHYYDEARALDGCLTGPGRAVFRVIFDTYRALLDRIEAVQYDVFSTRIRLSCAHKLGIALRALPFVGGGRLAKVAVIGGGLAGLAAAQALAERGHSVIVLESRNRLGGRAGSITDAATGQVIDACQHVSMRCCTQLTHFFRTVGVEHFLKTQKELYFLTPDGQMSRFAAKRLPVPFHLAPAFLRLHSLTFTEKLRVAYGLYCLRFARGDPPFLDWLRRHRQSQRCIDRFWSVVLVSALNESIDRIGLKYARKVFVDGFLTDRHGFEVQVPAVPLDRLYGDEMRQWFHKHNTELRLNAGVKSIDCAAGRVSALTMRNGEQITADWYIAALPPNRLLELLSTDVVERQAEFRILRQFEYSPIVSVHLWLDRPVMDLPHAVLVDSLSQWVFNRGDYLQVVISAAHDVSSDSVTGRVVEELCEFFPRMKEANVVRSRVVTEHAATFSVVPGVDCLRPGPRSPISNLLLAGDWTDTAWPATMESAVRSGYSAAAVIGEPGA